MKESLSDFEALRSLLLCGETVSKNVGQSVEMSEAGELVARHGGGNDE